MQLKIIVNRTIDVYNITMTTTWSKNKTTSFVKTLNWGNFHPFSSQASSAPKPASISIASPTHTLTPFRTSPPNIHPCLCHKWLVCTSEMQLPTGPVRKFRHILLYYANVGGGVKIDVGVRGGSFGNPMANASRNEIHVTLYMCVRGFIFHVEEIRWLELIFKFSI